MIDIKNKKDCCGCSACANICPTNAITMQAADEGFFYPVIDKDNCINCGLCEKVCPMLDYDDKIEKLNKPKVYGAWNLNEKIREQSSSGGIFTVLAESILNREGIVVGAAFDSDLKLKHVIVNTLEELSLLRGSKYLQSDLSDVLIPIRNFLKEGKRVLFTGTPCQVAGLNTFLKSHKYENLITCDIVCHGTPSPKIFGKYISENEEKEKQKVKSISFKDKSSGWKIYNQRLTFSNKEKLIPAMQTSFMKGFLQNLYLRPSCHSCPFSGIPRVADITLGDYWGVSKSYPELDDDKGTSLILINSSKGEQLFSQITDKLYYKATTLESAVAGNPCIIKPVAPHKKREQFFKEIDNKTLVELIKKYCPKPNIIKRVYRKLYRLTYKVKTLSLLRKVIFRHCERSK